ncbi:unnamed protein product [Candidula unifasciata]|uniref:Uncharacterized protein n=1 Tax=Candidula unifasciata TaxID=100452 RepID=A0A8S3ZVL8_9EUPU|nr:unnamed protein product [Candidula unifasciata]
MSKVTADLVILFICWTSLHLVAAKEFSQFTLDFLEIVTGDFDNRQQIESGGTDHAFIQFRIVPANMPLLQPDTVWYDEWAADGKLLHMQIGIISELPRDNILIDLYNFTEPSFYKPGEFNTSSLAGLKRGDLKRHNCSAVFRRLNKDVYVGYWPDCRSLVRGHHPNYADTFTCQDVSIIIPPTVEETFAQPPYIFQRKDTRYRFTGLPDTYGNFCGTKN